MAYHLGKVEGIEESMATKARLHWFWRGAIAAVLGLLTGDIVIVLTHGSPAVITRASDPYLVMTIYPQQDSWTIATLVAIAGPAVIIALAGFGFLTWWFGGVWTDGELHCRRCHHILRGLSEPRCPECGEAI